MNMEVFFPKEWIRYEESAIQRSAWLKLEDKDREFWWGENDTSQLPESGLYLGSNMYKYGFNP